MVAARLRRSEPRPATPTREMERQDRRGAGGSGRGHQHRDGRPGTAGGSAARAPSGCRRGASGRRSEGRVSSGWSTPDHERCRRQAGVRRERLRRRRTGGLARARRLSDRCGLRPGEHVRRSTGTTGDTTGELRIESGDSVPDGSGWRLVRRVDPLDARERRRRDELDRAIKAMAGDAQGAALLLEAAGDPRLAALLQESGGCPCLVVKRLGGDFRGSVAGRGWRS